MMEIHPSLKFKSSEEYALKIQCHRGAPLRFLRISYLKATDGSLDAPETANGSLMTICDSAAWPSFLMTTTNLDEIIRRAKDAARMVIGDWGDRGGHMPIRMSTIGKTATHV